jgi:class 3 adenylate cyclase
VTARTGFVSRASREARPATERGSEDALRPFVPALARSWAATGPVSDRHRRLDGSVVFVDVSGFTKLSERLARLGRVGAEHVTDAIGGRFHRLLAEAAAYGGALLKFGGDA